MKQYVTVAEASFLTGKSNATIYRWINSKPIRTSIDVDGIMLINFRDLMNYASEVKRGRKKSGK